ncbi:hypothetical protein [Halalkalibacter krulwichiae]|uniref:Helix-turn-helix domain-containing protein n=1 Tax=Halalkalibacter krulwichiae TaxID=199441 RepID=A0A1X9ME78_9BACI|nr:hypothetical protein [Halalkalibacter krulwichiae]ARK29841.1 hypothetical protein BkAM31D_08195 [Halalkalibacter krulwichiae]
MKSGRIEQFSHLSEFRTVKEFNQSIAVTLDIHGHHFTKGELIAFTHLTRFSVKVIGVCNARICKLVQACQTTKGGISRSTFERMLRKARNLGILSNHRTKREKGGYSHSVYVFHHFDTSNTQQLKQQHMDEKPDHTWAKPRKFQAETNYIKTKTLHNKDLRKRPLKELSLNELDSSFTPTYIPKKFVKAVKPFFNRTTEICKLWNQTQIAYRCARFPSQTPITSLHDVIVKALKVTVYQYKKCKIKTSFHQYYYGTLYNLFTYEKRKVCAKEMNWGAWLTN